LTPLGTTSSYYSATADLYTSQFTTAPAKPFPACCVLISRSLATASNGGDSSPFRAQVLLSQPPVQTSLSIHCQLSNSSIQFSVATAKYLAAISSLLSNCHLKRLSYPLSIITSAGLGFSLYSLGMDATENTVSYSYSVVACVFFAAVTCLPSLCIAVNFTSGSTIPAFRRHVTYLCVSFCVSSPVNCYWPSPAQLLVPSPAELVTLYYCLTTLRVV
jgi:hypothetical protein